MCYLKTNFLFIFYVICLLNISSNGAPKKWPSHYPRCFRDDPNLNKCMVEATKLIKPFLKQGIPEFNLPSISPFHVPKIVIKQADDSISYNIVLKNLEITGFDSYEFEKFDFDVKNLRFDSILHLGPVFMKGTYEAKGKILMINLNGNGNMSFNVSSSTGTLKQDGRLVTKKGISYLELDAPVIAINVGEITDYYYDGLFDGNEVFAKAAKQIFKDYQKELTEEIKPAVEKVIEEIVLDFEKKSTFRVPFDELYPTHS